MALLGRHLVPRDRFFGRLEAQLAVDHVMAHFILRLGIAENGGDVRLFKFHRQGRRGARRALFLGRPRGAQLLVVVRHAEIADHAQRGDDDETADEEKKLFHVPC